MKLFLTSYPMTKENELNPANGFVDMLKSQLPKGKIKGVLISAAPKKQKRNDDYLAEVKEAFEKTGIEFEEFINLDIRNQKKTEEIVKNSDLVILSGGHIPIQNEFFKEIGLKEILKDYGGVVLGISAGSMNAADEVYAHPTLRGEATNPDYKRFIQGLAITDISIIPHYSRRKDHLLDGIRLFEDIAYPDSMGREFYALNDGSYIFIDGKKRTIYGEAQLIKDSQITKINEDGSSLEI